MDEGTVTNQIGRRWKAVFSFVSDLTEQHLGLAILLAVCGGIGALILIVNSFPERLSHTASVNASIIRQPAQPTSGTVYHEKESTVFSAPPANQITQIQTRLIQLGYLGGRADGVWGARSQSALRTFKAANGLLVNDLWAEENELDLVLA